MLKRILLSIVLLLVIAYLVVAITAFNRKPAGQVCRDMELVIKDTVYAGFITKKEVSGMLEKKGIYPVGKPMDRIRIGLFYDFAEFFPELMVVFIGKSKV